MLIFCFVLCTSGHSLRGPQVFLQFLGPQFCTLTTGRHKVSARFHRVVCQCICLCVCLSLFLSIYLYVCLCVCACVGHGFDVLFIKVSATHVVWPPLSHRVVSQLIQFLTSPARRCQPVLVHGFSVGGYLYGETLVHIISNPELCASMSQRIRGQVFDSPVDFEGVPRGLGKVLTSLRPIQLTIQSSLEAYMWLFHSHVTKHYHKSSETFRHNPLRTPSLVLYSHADVVGTPGPIESTMATWRQRGVAVYSRCWQNTPHVRHYLHDPVMYTAELSRFLASIGLTEHTDDNDGGDIVKRRSLAVPASKLQ